MSATVTVVCPHCKNRMRTGMEYLGKRGKCPVCKSIIDIVPAEQDYAQSLQQSAAAERPGSLTGSGTDVNLLWAIVIAAGATVALYLLVFYPLRHTYFGELFVARGPVQYFTTLFACCGFAILGLKYFAVRQQVEQLDAELEFVPLEIGMQVTAENVDQFLTHIAGLRREQQQSILGQRIRGALEHFKYRHSVPEVQTYLATQAELDASGVDSGYTVQRVIIWAIPLLGFIGTVLGISQAVAALSGAFEVTPAATAAADPGASDADAPSPPTASSRLMGVMGQVSAGLASAFDTTFIALTIAILLLFPTESLRKTEYAMLDRIEKFTNDSLLRRMAERETTTNWSQSPGMVKEALEPAFREHQRWLAQWQAQVSELGRVIGADFEAAVGRVQEQLSQADRSRAESLRQLSTDWERLFSQLQQATGTWQRAGEKTNADLAAALASSERLQAILVRALPQLAETVQQFQSASPQLGELPAAVQDLRAAADSLRQTSQAMGQINGAAGQAGFWGRMMSRGGR